ncbi:hypothetical protein LGM89_04705 [Burkholderia sp. AU31624]|uniref:hypothetical protein n=1 Tax=Burkholderia sp. AU31624 TaxID=2879629 RepID=UPI001CF529B8|nr:hypothetical protein [Burkholderia sp. AU31624]MCA8252559.1 hypothetical protein [Burkholderia sp. AU31624]
MTPVAVREATARGHQVVIETGAGQGIGANDDAFLAAGARIAANGADVFSHADLIVKAKAPQDSERAHIRSHHIVFCYLHLALGNLQRAGRAEVFQRPVSAPLILTEIGR